VRQCNSIIGKLSWWALGALFVLMLTVWLFGCSLPFLQIVNPTYTVQLQTLDDIIAIKIPAELPDFVTGGICCNFEVGGGYYGIRFRGVIRDANGRLIDYYILVIKRGKPSKPVALRAVQMPTDRFWVYVKGEPIPSTQDQMREKIEGLIGKKI